MSYALRIPLAVTFLAAPAALLAAWVPGSELVGQSATVSTNGVSNTVYFDPAGRARIVSQGGTVHQAAWAATNGQLCLHGNGASECWPYAQPFRAGEAVTLTSNCASTSQWLATNVNAMPPEQPPQVQPERG